jgi:hypothetical protein
MTSAQGSSTTGGPDRVGLPGNSTLTDHPLLTPPVWHPPGSVEPPSGDRRPPPGSGRRLLALPLTPDTVRPGAGSLTGLPDICWARLGRSPWGSGEYVPGAIEALAVAGPGWGDAATCCANG